eukprot:gene22279-27242_t
MSIFFSHYFGKDGEGTAHPIGAADHLGLHDSFTVMVWVKPCAFITGRYFDNTILGQRVYENNNCLHLLLREGRPYEGFYANDLDGNRTLTCHEWHHLAFVYSLSEKRQSIYIDGRLSATAGNRRRLGPNSYPVYLSTYEGRGLNGFMSQMLIYRSALSEEQIKEAMFRAPQVCLDSPQSLVWHEAMGGGMVDITPPSARAQLAEDPSLPMNRIAFPAMPQISVAVSSEFSDLFNNPRLSDVTLVCGHWRFPSHRVLLYARCGYFQRMFRNDVAEQNLAEVELREDLLCHNVQAVELFFRVLYTMQVPEELDTSSLQAIENNLISILRIANYFAADGVVRVLEAAIVRSLAAVPGLDRAAIEHLATLFNQEQSPFLSSFLADVNYPHDEWRSNHITNEV